MKLAFPEFYNLQFYFVVERNEGHEQVKKLLIFSEVVRLYSWCSVTFQVCVRGIELYNPGCSASVIKLCFPFVLRRELLSDITSPKFQLTIEIKKKYLIAFLYPISGTSP